MTINKNAFGGIYEETEEAPPVNEIQSAVPAPPMQYADGDPNAEYHCGCGQSFNQAIPGHVDPSTAKPCVRARPFGDGY